MTDYNNLIDNLKNQTILCIGDLIFDEFVYGESSRISPEAPTPVLLIKRSEEMAGGAGNVAKNLSALGVNCIFISLVGQDSKGQQLQKMFEADPFVEPHFMLADDRPTIHKARFVSEKHSMHLLRVDNEHVKSISKALEDKIIELVHQKMPFVGAVILSDYAKGLLTPRLIKGIIENAKKLNKPIVVDPSGLDYRIYFGADVLTPNQLELSKATQRELNNEHEVLAAAQYLNLQCGSKAILVTRSEHGMMLVQANQYFQIPARVVRVRDVSGAGDTVVSVLASFLSMGCEYETAVILSNVAASIVVGKRGTSVLSCDELKGALFVRKSSLENKIIEDLSRAQSYIQQLKEQGLKIGFTNGCFDLLHPGHIELLNAARATCDFLIVGLNSDASVARLKGKERPVQTTLSRAKVLAGLSDVDLIVVFEEDTPERLIKEIMPAKLIKGADYQKTEVVGAADVENNGGEVILVELVPDQSTTHMIKKMNKN